MPAHSESPPLNTAPGTNTSGKSGYIPEGGFLRTTKKLFYERRLAARGNAIARAPGRPLNIFGIRYVPVILVTFRNTPEPFDAVDYENLLSGTNGPSFASYYSDVSQGKLQLNCKVLGWYKAPKDDKDYESGDVGIHELLQFAFTEADKHINFSQFDNDGEDGRPNSGDDNGIVDTVLVIHPKFGSECLTNSTNIWSHSWYFDRLADGGPFVTSAIRTNLNGTPRLDGDGHPEHIVINDYTIQPGLDCPENGRDIVKIGVICHEYGHALGLPDLYDRSYNSSGIGDYCLMSTGNYGGDGHHPSWPVYMSAWSRYYLGWCTPRDVTSAGEVHIDPVDDGNTVLRFPVPGTGGLEYFLAEYRRNGQNGKKANWDQYLPSSGLAVWHVDERVGSQFASWPFSPTNAGQNDSPVKLRTTPPPLFSLDHPLVALIQADRQMNLETGDNRGDSGDLYSSGNFEDDPTGTAGSRAYTGEQTDIAMRSIRVTNATLFAQAATVSPQSGGPLTTPLVLAQATLNAQFLSKLEKQSSAGLGELSSVDIQKLSMLSHHEILENVQQEGPRAKFLESWRTSRTAKVTEKSSPGTSVEAAVKRLLQKSDEKHIVQIQYSANRNHAEYINGLDLKPVAESPTADANIRLRKDKDLQRVLGIAGPLIEDASKSSTNAPAFNRSVDVGGIQLPVYSSEIQIHYGKSNNLVAATSTGSERQPKIENTAKIGALESKTTAASLLSVPTNSISVQGPGIYLVDGDTGKGRIAYKCSVEIGHNQQPLDVYVDAETKKVLDIK